VSAPPSPTAFGRYLLLERLGAGSTAEVFRVRPLRQAEGVGPELALRRLLPELADDEPSRARFLHEAEVARGLVHPLFCPVLEVGEADGLPYLVLDLIDGPTLARLLRWLRLRGRGAPLGAAVHVCVELCGGLYHAQAPPFGLVHGDVSPGNVLLGSDGRVKLIDGAAPTGEHASEVRGSLGYLAPEVLAGEATTHVSDLYGCAVLLWELVAHRRLFPARSLGEASRLRGAPLPALGEAGQPVEQTLRRALHRDPARRFRDGRALRAALLVDGRRAAAECSAAELSRLIRLTFG
jgi:serine/threonine protein kinase